MSDLRTGAKGTDWAVIVAARARGHCEIEDVLKGIIVCGPIDRIVVDGADDVYIHLKWVAQMGLPNEPGHGKWVRSDEKYKRTVFPNGAIRFTVESDPEKGKYIRSESGMTIYLEPDPTGDAKILAEIGE